MDDATRGLLQFTAINAFWLVTSAFFYWFVTPSFLTVPIAMIAAIGSGLMSLKTIRIFVLWFEKVKRRPPASFVVPALAIEVYLFLLVAMWAYFFVFLARTAEDAASFPFCSGSDSIDPKQFGIFEAVYFTITSFGTVGYGDIYACTSRSRWALVAELSNVVTIGSIGLPALVNLVSELAQSKFAQMKSTTTSARMPFGFGTMVTGMTIIVFSEPLVYGVLVGAFTPDGGIVRIYAAISAVLLIPIAVGALVLAANRMLGGHETRAISLMRAIQLVVLAYALFVEGFGYLYLLIDRPGANAFAFARSTEHRLDFGSANYFSLTTLTTTGFGDIAPLAPVARLAAVGQILIGIVFILFAFGLVASAIVGQRLQSRG